MGEKESYVVADIPGLIEGAHEGKGLGTDFLRHVQRCRILVHLVDPTQEDWTSAGKQFSEEQLEQGLPAVQYKLQATINNFDLINKELESFSKDLAQKKQIIVINKVDAITEDQEKALKAELKKEIGRKKRFTLYPDSISAATTIGVKELKNSLFQELQKIPKPEWLMEETKEGIDGEEGSDSDDTITHIMYRPHIENPKYYSVEKIGKGEFRVRGIRIEQIFNMTNFDNRQARARARDVLKKMGIDKELKKLGIKDGDMMFIGKKEMDFKTDFNEWDDVEE
jgi:GTP-binding protein